MQDTEVKTVVLVLGLPRCGTTSIAAALQADSLGIKSVLHASETAKHPARCEDILVALRYQDDDDIISRHSRICRATEGYAACAESLNALAEDLMDLYPDAKLILNIRPPSIPGETEGISWARSCKNTISFFTSPWVFTIVQKLSSSAVPVATVPNLLCRALPCELAGSVLRRRG
ncbi:hypothetical protein FOIG_06769 [Fusarium odoratissimum NRRL 54006]|uniref:Uncharacterized protein n=2 Tax=Fusarium oxysporum species complex TaxID=171631 RepID=X0JMV7_FUSO5|nr:uncharacterized protein FOIG_06769 [Fusarium odoratissimum NRRL 54006]EXM02619.1 hypothetical protein FOIG_06769 [Fusarium odoratissimum NRRL 54006]TXC06957.1 hypothetical protein FocTR4_00003713 [Fusarium oxysporum f. sp. cubense]